MTKQKYFLNRGFCMLLLLAFLQACSGSPGNVQPPPVQNGQTEIAPTNTPFQPAMNTPVSTVEDGILPSETSALALPSATNPSDVPSPDPLLPTIPPNNPTSQPPTQAPNNPTSPPPAQPPSNPTITPDIGTASPPGDPRIAVSPFTGPIPTIYSFKIEKFEPGEQVTVQIISKSTFGIIESFVIFMDGNGALTTQWTSQPNHAIGGYYVKVIGANHGKFTIGEFDIN